MSVRLQLDDAPSFYTNLDYINGRVILSLTADEDVLAILVKLEGESKTILARPPGAQQHLNPSLMTNTDQRQGVATETHKVLYQVSQVLPGQSLGSSTATGSSYTLQAGQHEYPFRFKIPFNNICSNPESRPGGIGVRLGGFRFDGVQQSPEKHIRGILPPSLIDFHGQAEIRYYVKVTVQRRSKLKQNRRAMIGFKFMPIEPPRAPPVLNEVYARRACIFQACPAKSLNEAIKYMNDSPRKSDAAPNGEVDARLPNPAVLTCNEPVPLRIIWRKLSESLEQVYLMSLQVHLIGSTEMRAGDILRVQTTVWMVMSSNRMIMPLGSSSEKAHTETLIDDSLWSHILLPNTIAPSFYTCNLIRRYILEVSVGLGYGTSRDIQAETTLPLRFPVEVFSGISPSAALLDALASRSIVDPARAYSTPTSPQLGDISISGMGNAPPSYEDIITDDFKFPGGVRKDYSGVTDVDAPGLEKTSSGPGDVRDEPAPPPSYE